MGKKIVLIEDHVHLRETTAELLELSEYEVISAYDGLDGLRKIKLNSPDLILCDIMMPNLDGYGVLHILSRDENNKDIPFIFLTAKADRSDLRIGMDLGADDYITKPFHEVELLKSIETRLKKSKKNLVIDQLNLNKSELALNQFAYEFLTFSENKIPKYTHQFVKNSPIFSESEPPSRVFYLQTGRVKLYQVDESGKQFITKFISPGDFFGYVDVLEEQNYRENAEAMEESLVYSISSDEFKQILANNNPLEIHFRKLLTADLIQNERNMMAMAYGSLRIRVARVLIELAENENAAVNKPFHVRIKREDLANKMGTASESVIRTLTEFKKEGLVEVKGSQLIIKDLPN